MTTEISSPFAPDEIASDKDPFENFDILIEEIKESQESDQPKSTLKQKVVKEVFKSPVSSLTLPAVATKLAKDIDENQKKFKNNDFDDQESPIIDLSSLDIFSDLDISTSKFFDAEDITLFDGKKRKRNPLASSSEIPSESKGNDFNDTEPPVIDLSSLDIFGDFELPSSNYPDEDLFTFDGNKRKRNPSIPTSSDDNIIVVVSNDCLKARLIFSHISGC